MPTTIPLRILTLAALLSGAGAPRALAQSGGPYQLNWSTLDAGGGRCAGGSFALHGTIGQPESGEEVRNDLPVFAASDQFPETLTAGTPVTAVRSGFWAGTVSFETVPRLNIESDAAFGRVIVSWPYPSTGYVLQHTLNLNRPNGGWTNSPVAPIPVGNEWQIDWRTTNTARWFRLRKP